jgi:hypothetical protein
MTIRYTNGFAIIDERGEWADTQVSYDLAMDTVKFYQGKDSVTIQAESVNELIEALSKIFKSKNG